VPIHSQYAAKRLKPKGIGETGEESGGAVM